MAKKNTVAKQTGETDRAKALESALKQIEKAYGKGSIMRIDGSVREKVPSIPTGSLGLDEAIGVGGLPQGRIVEIFGPESSGKTTLTLHAVANAQAAGGVAAFIDAEHAFDSAYAEKLGVRLSDLLVSQPDSGEQALEVAELLVRSGAVDIVVVDSVAALVPRAEIEGEMGDSHVGLQARLMSQALRKLTACVSKSRTCLVFINQLREKIGVVYGSPETTPGGRALKFYASVRLDIRRIGSVKDGDIIIGNTVRVKVVKNKIASPFRQATFEMMFGEGISREGELIDLGDSSGALERSGSWYSFGETRIGQGRERVRQFLKDNPDIAMEIAAAVRERLGLVPPLSAQDDEKDAPDEAPVEEEALAAAS